MAKRLRQLGHQSVLSPVLMVERAARLNAEDLSDADVLVFTSARAVSALAEDLANSLGSLVSALRVFAVGNRTAHAARLAGFKTVTSADGAGEDLLRLLDDALAPHSTIVHPRGEAVAVDIAHRLRDLGHEVQEHVLYRTVPAAALSAEATQCLNRGEIDAAVFLSPRTVDAFAALSSAAQRSPVRAHCLSEAIADRARGFGFGAVTMAAKPTADALFASL
ncbi:MAG: uroporphyrinogen-III synthase [Pseudomonadota bacterium]